ncbi:hypothetical protein V6N11_048063 [Hibiscus sabdariffa]|uniref:Uncharacterized protein n=2 Tax=Hibiscus sabdariffa TaxID=183260 RepID=A0ABR1ZVN1_9ROSI
MRISGVMVLLLFPDSDKRKRVLEENVLDLWMENKLAELWGDLVCVDGETLAPTNFERGRFQVETSFLLNIDEQVELQVGDDIFIICVAESEDVYVSKRDCCRAADEVSCSGSLSQGGEIAIDSLAASDCETSLVHKGMQQNSFKEDMVVPNSVSMEVATSSHIVRLWEDNWRIYDHVMEISEVDKAGSYEDGAGLVTRAEEVERDVDIMQAMDEIGDNIKASSDLSSGLDVGGELKIGPRQERARVNKALSYYNNGQPKRVRQISEINCSLLSPSRK